MEANRFVVVRGTPAIGKTTILEQTANFVLEKHRNIPLFVVTGWDQESVEAAGGWEMHLKAVTGIDGNAWRTTSAILLVDEAQCSYWDLTLWSVFFKALHGAHGPGPWVALFASYGSPGGGYAGLDENRKRFRPTPIRLGGEAGISIREKPVDGPWAVPIGLLLNFDDTVACLRHLLRLNDAMFTDDLTAQVAAVSGGHVGILSSMVDVIVRRTEVRTAQQPAPVASCPQADYLCTCRNYTALSARKKRSPFCRCGSTYSKSRRTCFAPLKIPRAPEDFRPPNLYEFPRLLKLSLH